MVHILLDGDIFIFKAALAAEKPVDWGGGLWTLHAYLDDGKKVLDEVVHKVVDKFNDDHKVIVALSDTVNFRYKVYPRYKHNRKDKRRPMLINPLREYMMANYHVVRHHGLEADDVLGVIATKPKPKKRKGKNDEYVIVSSDKDMKTLPGYFYDCGKDEFHTISTLEADYWHFMQTLTGDVADGYPGCPGYGPKTAEKLLAPFLDGEMSYLDAWEAIVGAYEFKGQTREDALTMARISRICRYENIDEKTGGVILWEQPWTCVITNAPRING